MSKFGFGFGAPVMGPMAGFGANNGRVPKYTPGAVQSSPMAELYRNQNPDEEYMRMMQMLDSQSRGQNRPSAAMHAQPGPMPPQAPAPEQSMPDQPIKAPSNRGMFGRFLGGLGKVAGKAGEFAMFGPVGMQIRADHRRSQERTEQKAAEEEARRQQMLQQFAGMEGLTPQQQMLIRNGFGVEQLAEQQFAPLAAAKFGLELTEVTDPVTGEKRLVQASEAGGVREVEGFVPAPPAPIAPGSAVGKLAADLRSGAITQEQYDIGIQQLTRAQNEVKIDLGGAAPSQYQGLPDGTYIEPPPGTSPLPRGQTWVVRNGQAAIEAVSGSEAEREAQEAETKRLGRQASTQRAGRTVVREVGRGLELMPKIIGWGDAPAGGEADTTGAGEIVTANARIAASKIPGTAEYQFMNNIESALSNVGLDVLQNMRDNSPTGGALGQVPIQQQQRLEQVLGAFKIGMPRPVIEENLKYMNNAYMDIMFGSKPERDALVAQGKITPEDNAEIDKAYYDLNWDRFGRMAPTAAAVDALKANPNLREQFDAKYGQGSADKFLGGR